GKVNNAEAPHSETRTIFNEYTFVIRSAVNDTVAHLAHQIYGDVAFSGCTYNSCNSAHIPCIYPFATTESDSVFLIGVMFLTCLNRYSRYSPGFPSLPAQAARAMLVISLVVTMCRVSFLDSAAQTISSRHW